MKYRICFVVPYFGKLQNYFPLFLKTCERNDGFHWLIFTDDDTPYNYPENVTRVPMTFEDVKRMIQSKLDFPISLERPYKLCDYRPLYGYIFAEWLKDYTHWGHCDTDTIMGSLKKFITDEMLDEYDKIFQLGHMAIYKNNEEINRIAMRPLNGVEIGKQILQNPKNCWFDEEWDPEHNTSVNKILKAYGKKIFMEDLSLNIGFRDARFVRCKFVGKDFSDNFGFEFEELKDAVYQWKEGNLFRQYKEDGKLIREDFPYMHMQQRKMVLHPEVLNLDWFKIVNDEFLPMDYITVNIDNFDNIKKVGKCWHKARRYRRRIINKLKVIFGI